MKRMIYKNSNWLKLYFAWNQQAICEQYLFEYVDVFFVCLFCFFIFKINLLKYAYYINFLS